MNLNNLISKKVTIYTRGVMGVTKIEARSYLVEVGPYAQYTAAVSFAFVAKGQRNPRGTVQTFQPSLLILDGWGHPDPAGAFTPAEKSDSGAMVSRGRFSACSPEWSREFDVMIATYVAAAAAGGKPVSILADYRGHNPHSIPASTAGIISGSNPLLAEPEPEAA